MSEEKRSRASRLPVGTSFTPALIDLPSYLRAVVKHSGNRDALIAALHRKPVWIGKKEDTSERAARLPLEAGIRYGLIERGSHEATELARRLEAMEGEALYAAFARHILLSLGGLRVVEAIEQMEIEGLPITGNTIPRYLTEQNFPVTEQNAAINAFRGWLAKAGLFPESKSDPWAINPAVKERLVGLNDHQIAALVGLTPGQVAYALALAQEEPTKWVNAAAIRDQVEATTSLRYGRGSLPKEVLEPLRKLGLIEYDTGLGTKQGKATRLRITSKFKRDVLSVFLRYTLQDLDPVVTAYYKTRPEDIFARLDDADKNIKGHALEAFSVYLMRRLGLRFIGWRRRAKETGYAEVDVLLAGLFGAQPTTWQVQCKNTKRVELNDVAKEVGLLPLTNATHILVVTTGKITSEARRYVREINNTSAVTLFVLDERDLNTLRDSPGTLGGLLRRQAERIMQEKMAHVVWGGLEKQAPASHPPDFSTGNDTADSGLDPEAVILGRLDP